MGFYDVANHPLIYGMVIAGLTYVAAVALISVVKSWRRAKELGYSSDKLKEIARNAAAFTIVPSLAILVGFFSLAAMLGIPWPWWRLSVIGSVTYETMAANMALNTMGVNLATATAKDFVLVMFVMSIGIISGLVMSIFVAEKIHKGSVKSKDKDPRWGSLGNSVFMLAIIIAFVVPMLFDGPVKLLTLLTSCGVSLGLGTLARKYKIKWLGDFVLVFTMLISMASSVLWTSIFI